MMGIDRGRFLSGLASALALPTAANAAHDNPFAAIERRRGGRLGVVALDLATGRTLSYRGDQRFPLASTWKVPLVMMILARVDARRDRLDRRIRFRRSDLEPYSVIAERFPHGGVLTLREICAHTIAQSDNTGADLLAPIVGGPRAVTRYLRTLGIRGVRVDRFERDLTRPTLAEQRDTGTPAAMARLCARLVTNSPLTASSTAVLLRWMRATETGKRRLRAGVPAGWTVADKTGSYDNVANDIGLLYPPAGKPIAIACFTINVPGDHGGSAAVAEATRVVARRFRPASGR